MKKFFSNSFLLLGIVLLLCGFYLLYLRQSPRTLKFSQKPTTVNTLSYQNPYQIQIPSIGVNLPIIPAVIKNHNWETTSAGVSYLQSSPLPGQKGNSVMYGHNWTSILGNLPKVKTGDVITVTMHDGKKKDFRIEYTAVVTPDQDYIIDNTNDVRLTLYTCTGFLDSKRFVVVAKPIS